MQQSRGHSDWTGVLTAVASSACKGTATMVLSPARLSQRGSP